MKNLQERENLIGLVCIKRIIMSRDHPWSLIQDFGVSYIFCSFLSCHTELSLGRRGSLCLKGQIKVFDDLVYDFIIFDK